MLRLKYWGFLFCFFGVTILPGYAQEVTSVGVRSQRNFGADLSLGEPFPSVAGVMVGYNILDYARISLGAGSFWYWASYQVDGKIFFSADNTAPYFGTGVTYLNGRANTFLGWDLAFDNIWVPYIEGGVDHTTELGFHFNFNVGVAIPAGRAIILPGLAAGWYF